MKENYYSLDLNVPKSLCVECVAPMQQCLQLGSSEGSQVMGVLTSSIIGLFLDL